jgi:hypothetical protein
VSLISNSNGKRLVAPRAIHGPWSSALCAEGRWPTATHGTTRDHFWGRTVWAVFIWSRSTIFLTRLDPLKILVCLCPKMWFGGISQASLHRQLAHPALTARTFISLFEHAYYHLLIPLWDQCFLLLLEPYCLTWPCASAKEVFLTPQN